MPRAREAGFTLLEALIAIVVIVFGLVAVTNLILVASRLNLNANQSTGATVAASEQLETLRAVPFQSLARGGSLTSDAPGFFSDETLPGVGVIHIRWSVSNVPGRAQLVAIAVRAEAKGAFGGVRTRAEYGVLRACVDPIPATAGGICGKPPCCPFPP